MQQAASLLNSEIIKEVPVRSSSIRVQNGIIQKIDDSRDLIDDPALLLLEHAERGYELLLGGFGQGKTTTALRAVTRLGKRALFLPAARLTSDLSNSSKIFERLVDVDRILEDADDEDRPRLEQLLRMVVGRLLTRPESNLALIIDGLDEAPLTQGRGGVAVLFNSLASIRVPVVLTMRTEFWRTKLADFSAALADEPQQLSSRRKIPVLELSPWSDIQISRMIDDVVAGGDVQRRRLAKLRDLVGTQQFADLYGDIPRRPLFLRMLIDEVMDAGLHEIRRIELVDGWVRRKLVRDWINPMILGGAHRPPLGGAGEDLTGTVELSYSVMKHAARLMMREGGSSPELLPDVLWDNVVAAIPAIAVRGDIASLVTQSLLQVVETQRIGSKMRLRFAHRAFQEFFLAYYIVENGVEGKPIPEEVTSWVREMIDAGFPAG